MSEITAEMISQGRRAGSKTAQQRRHAHQVQEAREKLTSGGEGHGVFEYDLVRIYAQNRINASLRNLIATLFLSALTMLWAQHLWAIAWTIANFAVIGACHFLAHWFLTKTDRTQMPQWRRRFISIEFLQGFLWGVIAFIVMAKANADAKTAVISVLMVVCALETTTAATIPLAVYAAVIPAGAVVLVLKFAAGAHPSLIPTVAFISGAELFFIFLCRKLYDTTLGALYAQAEKDGLIAELEQAKANSDEARRRAEEANLAKSRFLATMSHELRTPLNAIVGFSEIMKDEMMGAHKVEAYRGYAKDIHSSGEHLLGLINEILDLSRVEAGRYELKEDAVSVSAIIEDCRHLLTLRAQKRGITLVELIESNLPRIWVDERAIRQIALNLLTNAIKFTPQGGQVTIKVGWTAVGGQYFSIRDTGPGIPEQEIPVVLSSFGRGALAQKNADEGSGLGLPIVKGLVELHGGVFSLRSKVREGTEVIVILPPERVMTALPQLDQDHVGEMKRPSAKSYAA